MRKSLGRKGTDCAALHAVRKPRPHVRRSERQGKPLTKLAQGAKTLESSVSQLRGGVSRRNVGHGKVTFSS